MFFRNLTLFRFPREFTADYRPLEDLACALHDDLEAGRLQPVGPMALASYGFISPYGIDQQQMCVGAPGPTWITLGAEEKLMPSGAVNKAVHDRMKAASERMGLAIGPKQRRAYREEVIADMLPKAFVQPKRCDAYLDWDHGLLVIDTSSRKVAEQVVSEIRAATGSFPAMPLNAEVAPRAVLTGWLAGEPLPRGFALGDECELRSPAEYGGVVKCQRVDLGDEDISKHLQSGMQCRRLALVYNSHVSFVIGEDLVLRKVKFLDGVVDRLADEERDTVKQELDARFTLMAGEVAELFAALVVAFKLSPANDMPAEVADATVPKVKKRKGKALEGVDTVQITGPGVNVTMSSEELLSKAQALHEARDSDELYDTAVSIVVDNGHASISRLQRHLKIGYNRAARLIEAMESAGVVSPPAHNGDRTVLQKGDFS